MGTRATSLGSCGTRHTRAATLSHLRLYLSQITAWHRERKVNAWGRKGAGLVAVEEKGWGSWVKGRKGVKSHLELYAFPSLSPIQINWIYAAIVWLKPRTPGASPLSHRKSFTLKAKAHPVYLSRPYKPNNTGCTLCTQLILFIINQGLIILPNSQQLAWLWKFKHRLVTTMDNCKK